MKVLEQNETWDSMPFPKREAVSCCWVCVVNTIQMTLLLGWKARFVAKGYSQMYGVDYQYTFSLYGQNNLCASSYFSCCYLPLASASAWHQELSYMMFLRKRFTWSNHLVLLLRGSLRKFVNWINHCTSWNSLLKHGLRGLHWLFRCLDLFILWRIILSSFSVIRGIEFCWLSTWMTWWLQVIILWELMS